MLAKGNRTLLLRDLLLLLLQSSNAAMLLLLLLTVLALCQPVVLERKAHVRKSDAINRGLRAELN